MTWTWKESSAPDARRPSTTSPMGKFWKRRNFSTRGACSTTARPPMLPWCCLDALPPRVSLRRRCAWPTSRLQNATCSRRGFWNTGDLPPGLTLGDLPLGGVSRPHNPDTAYVLFQVGLIERLAIGGRQTASACHKAALSPPQYTKRGHILLTFWNEERKESLSLLPERMCAFLTSLSPGQHISASDYHN